MCARAEEFTECDVTPYQWILSLPISSENWLKFGKYSRPFLKPWWKMSNDMVKMLNSFWRTLFEEGKYFLKVVPRFRHWPKEVSKAISWILPSSCCYFTFLSGVLSLSSQGVWRGESHRMADIWRYIQGSADPAFLLKQGHLELVAWDHVRLDFAYLQRWRLHKISRLFLLVISQLQSKKVFPFVQTGPSVFGFVPISYEYSLLCLPYILPFRRMKFHISLL